MTPSSPINPEYKPNPSAPSDDVEVPIAAVAVSTPATFQQQQHQQPSHTSVEIVRNPDGSSVKTTTVTNPDGSKTVTREVTQAASVAPQQPGVVATATPETLAQPGGTQRAPPAPADPIRALAITSIVLILLALILGIVAGVFTVYANDDYNDDWETDRDVAIGVGSMSTISFIVAVPLMACAACQSTARRGARGSAGLMIAGWVLYGIAILNSLGLIAAGAAGEEVYPGWVFFAVFWNLVPWAFMMAHAEMARKG